MCRGNNLFPTAFIEYLTTDGPGEKAKKEALLAEFQKLEDYLANSKADYFGGSDVCSSKPQPTPLHFDKLTFLALTVDFLSAMCLSSDGPMLACKLGDQLQRGKPGQPD